MKAEGADFAAVLADAQKHGYAETPPDLDIDGHDAQHKIGILASLAHGFWVDHHQIHTEGIRDVSKLDMQFAAKLGYTIKLLGIAKQISGKKPPACKFRFIRRSFRTAHVLASVNGVFNAVLRARRHRRRHAVLRSRRGQGRHGQRRVERRGRCRARFEKRHEGSRARRSSHTRKKAASRRWTKSSRAITSGSASWTSPACWRKSPPIFAAAKIGISSVIQPEGHEGESVPLIFMIHDAPNAAMRKALAKIAKLPAVKGQAGHVPGGKF